MTEEDAQLESFIDYVYSPFRSIELAEQLLKNKVLNANFTKWFSKGYEICLKQLKRYSDEKKDLIYKYSYKIVKYSLDVKIYADSYNCLILSYAMELERITTVAVKEEIVSKIKKECGEFGKILNINIKIL